MKIWFSQDVNIGIVTTGEAIGTYNPVNPSFLRLVQTLCPLNDLTSSLGLTTTSARWGNGFINHVYTNNLQALSGGITVLSSLLPSGSVSLGDTNNRWTEAWVTGGLLITSDENLKKEIEPVGLGLNFINELKPKKYKWKDESLNKKNRKVYGLMAQDIEATLIDCGCGDFD